ncbi:tetratricopeptide repeat protein [Ichthyophthirius multifiliis]|uniref:Tetratricopeptide repeat protein n=1 Tax=Ichthyophthirius multifiliis TaxID=5932 RepID=G0QLF3_ICHMU|nr:tetratricopeptide repeat protein [Ichthyophthirius multifiliis]EGR33947.1 tetratricopeptide repeat protein [Ichthyophthirius multifiliis]|eukprot:XP_004039251.1 tetratricopeptide repeat protein [Ichthyophthirius multifiliis]
MAQPDPKLLSMLEKVSHPILELDLKLKVHGVYNFPEEWKQTDELNPTLFSYSAKIFQLEAHDGKLHSRELTEKELKEQEELALQKNKKAPAAKKDKNAVQEVILTPEEEEQLRLQQEIEAEKVRVFQSMWDQLDEQGRFYHISEDKYKQGWINWEKDEDQTKKEGEDLDYLEECIYEKQGEYIYFQKNVLASDDEIVKMKKTKPKGLNLADLNNLTFRAWVNLKEFENPGTIEITQRCQLEQVISEDSPSDLPKFNTEKCYIKISLILSQAISPLVEEVKPTIEELVPKNLNISKQQNTKSIINELKNELVGAIESLALEYQMFGSQNNTNSDNKNKGYTYQQKAQEAQGRKELFLYHFGKENKYKILKEKLKKSIIKICRDKFQKNGFIQGITNDQKDMFYSEIYVFLIEQTRQTLSDLIELKKEDFHEDIILTYEQSQKERDKILINITKESQEEKLLRLSNEYEIINQIDLAEKYMKNLIYLNSQVHTSYFQYTKFLLRNKNFNKAEMMLEQALKFDPLNKDYQLLMSSLYLRRNRHKECLNILNKLLNQDKACKLYNTMISIIYQKWLNDQKQSEKYKKISEKIYLKNQGMLPPKINRKKFANPFETPNFKPIINDADLNKGPTLQNDQWDEIYLEVIDYFQKNSLYELVEQCMEFVFDNGTSKVQLINCQIQLFKENYGECLNIVNKLLVKNKNSLDVQMLKANICYLSDKLYECEEVFLKALKLRGQKNQSYFNPIVFLRLGSIYLQRKSWGDAKKIFAKSVDNKPNSSLSWLGLGIACLRLNEKKEAEEALTQSNIYDSFNGEVWGYLALLCLLDKSRLIQSDQCLGELIKTDVTDIILLEELGDELSNIGQYINAEIIYSKIIEIQRQKKQYQKNNLCDINVKYGKIKINLRKYKQALQCFEEALKMSEGETQKAIIKELIQNAIFYSNNSRYD